MKKLFSLVLAAAMTLALAPSLPAAAASVPTLTVDMTEKTGPMRHGSAGFLYGLGSHGTPNANTLTPLKPDTAVQKAPDGLQHPTGDVLDVAETFIEAGGEQVQIYLQDIFALWSYEYTDIDDYLERIKEMVPKIVALRDSHPDFSGKFVYVPYNEPDGIWFGGINDRADVQDKFNDYWQKAYTLIKELDPDALIGGASYSVYQPNAMESWIRFCAENGCEPDYITWHELQTDKLSSFKSHLDHYRGLESKYGMEQREIIINEYAPQNHCSVPGKLVNWIALFEENKVSGCLPYWHNAGNLNDIAADNNEPNGAWWLYKWYGDMSGETLSLTTSTARDKLYGLASIDDNKKSANVIFGGVDGAADIVLENIAKTEAFNGASAVNVKIEATYWTAFHGVAAEPAVIRSGVYAVENGAVTVELDGMEASAAYNITVTAAAEGSKPGVVYRGPWRKTWEAEDATLVGGAWKNNGDNNRYAYSGGYRVSGIDSADAGVDFAVDVPISGFYRADMIYGNGLGLDTAHPADNNPVTVTQSRSIDGEEQILTLENTLRWTMAGMYTDYIELEEGAHTFSYRGTGGQGASIDCLSLTYAGGEIPAFDSVYEAELADFNTLLDNAETAVKTESEISGHSGSGYVTGLDNVSVKNGGGVRFTVVVPDNGLYDLTLRYAGNGAAANIYLDNTALTLDNFLTEVELPASAAFASAGTAVFLQKGINIIDIDTSGPAALDYLRVRRAEGAEDEIVTVEAESGSVTGGETAANAYAGGGSYVPGLEAAHGYENIENDFTVTGLNDTLLSYESAADAELIYADYDEKGRLAAVKRVSLPAGEAVKELESGHDEMYIWYSVKNLRPAAEILADAEGGSLEIPVTVPEAGDYKMVIRYSNSELFGAHNYNAQIVDRYASYSVNGGEGERVYFKNTFSDDNWRTVAVPVRLEAGENTVKFYNDNWRLVRCGVLKQGESEHIPENIDYQTLANLTPNFDSFSFAPAVAEASSAAERYKISVMATDGGSVSWDKSSAEAGESVTLTLKHDYPDGDFAVTANGEDVTSLIRDGALTVEITENTDFRVMFILPENLDKYIVNNSFGSGLDGWTAESVTIEGEKPNHRAVFGEGGSLSQTVDVDGPGYYTLTLKAEGEGRVSFGASEAEITAQTAVTAYGEDKIELAVTGKAGLSVGDFHIADVLPADTSLLYFVDCGDRNTSTLSEGDSLGLYNSVTEQFYGFDSVTGKKWGIDDTYVKNDTYPTLLTGEYTWPYEYSEVEDGCAKTLSYRYAKDQDDRTGPGVTYRFELPDGRYNFEVGFYTSWSITDDNRKADLTVNGKTVAAGVIPSTDAANPVIVSATAEVSGGEAALNLKLTSDGKGGPMMSWIKISRAINRIDTAGMVTDGAPTWNNDQNTKADKAFDGDPETYYDGDKTGSVPDPWLQIDMGEERDIAAIGFVPRKNDGKTDFSERMKGGEFLVSKDASKWEKLYTIPSAPAQDRETCVPASGFLTDGGGWRYLKFQTPNEYCNVAEIYIYEAAE